ncbi:MAG: basic amino acid/polyamine antiporter, family [Gaiellaceae bacterium]|jgi:APA family basic amino acid/polyamine antiporter|nr:basic amino acid/polyamine antiporter, family [Gaiellaceae bacterium]
MSRRRRQQRLERVLGTPALFATAYGNVGSSIYYALGVTAVFALGLTPLVFLIAGVFFSLTALTYAEGTVRFPEAGGSSSFARHAFNELASFGAAWAQMLNYIITIAISAFFVPHYLSIFWAPLKQNPWDVIGGSIVIAFLVILNVIGIQESSKLNIFLALIDFATQLLLVLLGFVLIFSPHTLTGNIHWGTAPTWSQFFLAIPVGMIAYTGIETVSNLAEETRDPVKSIPRSIGLVAVAVYAIYFTLPLIALSALPVERVNGKLTTLLALPPEKHGFQNDPVLGLVENLGISGTTLSVLKVYVGILAATILFIATNAGIIGASRITYSMATYRQLPEVFRRLHPKYKTPWLSLIVFAGFISILVLLPGQTRFLGTMYSFGAMLSFTVAHAAIVQLRRRYPDEELAFRSRPNLRIRGIDWPLFAVFGGAATALAWLVVVLQSPGTRYAGLGWLVLGFTVYAIYRKRVVKAPLTETVRAPVVIGPAIALEYRNVLVPIVWRRESEAAVDLACRLASERRGSIIALSVLEVPLELPLDGDLPEGAEHKANDLLDEARAIGDAYGVNVIGRLVRGRRAGRAIVDEATRRNSEIIVMGAPRRDEQRRRGRIFGGTVDFVLKNAPCRVMVAAAPRAA